MDRFIKIGRGIKSIIAPRNQDLKIVVLSILGATIIWILSALNKTYTSVIKCPIHLEYEKEGTIAVKTPPEFVEANVTGGGWDLLKQNLSFNNQPLKITLDNPIETKQIAGYAIQPLMSQHLGSLNLNFIITDSISFNIQRLKSKRMFLKIDELLLDLEDLYEIVSPIVITPDTAWFTGPSSMIDTLADTLLLKIPYETIDEDINQPISANPFDQTLVLVDPPLVYVQIDVSKIINFRKEFQIELVNFPADSSVSIDPIRIGLNFKIQEEFIDIIPESDFIIIADYNNINQQDSSVTLEIIETPFYVEEVTIDTSQVKLVYAKEKTGA